MKLGGWSQNEPEQGSFQSLVSPSLFSARRLSSEGREPNDAIVRVITWLAPPCPLGYDWREKITNNITWATGTARNQWPYR